MARGKLIKLTDTERPAPDPLWTPKDLSDYIGLTVAGLAQMRYTGTGPTFVKLGHQIRYRQSDIEQWIADRTRAQTGAAK
ncbi:hypothetical protein BH09ACT8_BH09ACT8_30960 [soil metagenome]